MDWELIREEFQTSKITLKALAEKHDIKLGTLKSRKSREGWVKDATKVEKVASKNDNGKHRRKQAKRSGNPNPKNQFTKRNRAAVTHGLFAKYLPTETLKIVNEIDSMDPLDILWMNIKMQFASIMRAQQIMFVTDKQEMIKEIKKVEVYGNDKETSEKQEWEFQFAWDRQANFLNSQSRAMSELRNMLKQFVEMADYSDVRRLEVEKLQAVIDKTKAETAKIASDDGGGGTPVINIVDRWSSDDERA